MPFLVLFPFSLAPSLLIFSYCHSQVATCVFFFLYPIFFWFLPSFPFLLHIFFPFPSLLLWRPFSFPFFLSLSLLLSFSPLLFGAPLRPPGVQAHAMHPPGYATELKKVQLQERYTLVTQDSIGHLKTLCISVLLLVVALKSEWKCYSSSQSDKKALAF